MVEFHLGEIVLELAKGGLGLSRKSDDESRPEAETRDAAAKAVHESRHGGLRSQAVHPLQSYVMNVLQRHVHIFGHLGLACIQVDQFIRDLLRIEIEWADPAQPRYLDDITQQAHQTPAESKVDSVVDSILGYEINLFNTLRR